MPLSVVKTLSTGTDSSNVYREMNLHFDVPETKTYFIAFLVTTPAGGRGLLLDDVAIRTSAGLVNDAADLVGNADNTCNQLEGYGLNGFAYTRFVDAAGRLGIEIDPNGNDLGDVTVEMKDYAESPSAPYLGERVMSRHFNVLPQRGPGPYTLNGGVKVRLYYTAAELAQYSSAIGEDLDWEDIIVAHYSDVNEDCEIANSTGFDVTFEEVEQIEDFGGAVYALEFFTTSFSEFSATSVRASQGFPVTLRAFDATRPAEL